MLRGLVPILFAVGELPSHPARLWERMKLKDLKKVYIPQGPAGFSTFIAAAVLALCEMFSPSPVVSLCLFYVEGIMGRGVGDEAAGAKERLSSLTPQLLGGWPLADCSLSFGGQLGAAGRDRQHRQSVTLPWKCGQTEPWAGDLVKLDLNSL